MTGYALAVLIVGLVVFGCRRVRETQRQINQYHPTPDNYQAPAEEDELLAVITAAIEEFEGTGNFQVLSIKPSGRTWAITGRQEQLHS